MEWQLDAGLRSRPLRPFGMKVDHDLSAQIAPETAARLVALVREHSLVVARGQSLDRERHETLLGLFGPVVARREGDPGFISSDAGAGRIGPELAFHADAAYTETPFDFLSLHAIDVADDASSTRFVDVQRGLDLLAPELVAQLAGRNATMMSAGMAELGTRICERRDHETRLCRRELPAIRVNPHTGRRYVAVSAMHTAGLVGLAWEDGRDLLNRVFDRLYAAEAVHEHVWRNGDVVIWDNVACQHARGRLDEAGRRILQRVIVGLDAHAVPHAQAA